MTDFPMIRLYPSLPPCDRSEALRYAGVKEKTPELEQLLECCLFEYGQAVSGKVCYMKFPMKEAEKIFMAADSRSLTHALAGCEEVVLFAATIGLETDRLIAKYAKLLPSKSLMFQAIGAERVECLCDVFCGDIEKEQALLGLHTSRRVSPGYGDLPLLLQENIFRVLDYERKIGLTLNSSFFMTPTKSVTAIFGIGKNCTHGSVGCAGCGAKNCDFRKA